MTEIKLGNVDEKIREALRVVFSEILYKIEQATDGLIVVSDLKINTYTVDVSVTMKIREEDPENGQ